jgi:hypothetical protein
VREWNGLRRCAGCDPSEGVFKANGHIHREALVWDIHTFFIGLEYRRLGEPGKKGVNNS